MINSSRTSRTYKQEEGVNEHNWPLHDIAITNIVWCMSYTGEVGGGRILRNGRAIALQ